MNDVSKEILMVIEWGIVPAILMGVLAHFLLYNPGKDAPVSIQRSSFAGKYAGLLTFAIFVLSRKNKPLFFSLDMPVYEFDILVLGGAVLGGALLSWIFKLVKNKIFIGAFHLAAIALACTGIYAYLFMHELRGHLVFVSMGIMLGIFLFMIFYPRKTVQKDNPKQIESNL